MARSKGTNNFSGSLEVNAGAPLDARLVVDTQTDLTALDSFPYHYVGMVVAVKDTGKLFMLIGSDPMVSANWKEIGAGAIDTTVYKPSGTIVFEDLPTLSASVIGNVYNIANNFTTTSDFVEGEGHTYSAGSNVVCVDIGTAQTPIYKYDVLSGIIDLSEYQKILQVTELPIATALNVGTIYQYTGTTQGGVVNGHFYQAYLDDTSGVISYGWKEKDLLTFDSQLTSESENAPKTSVVKAAIDKKEDTFRFTTMPTASSTNVGQIIQYTGATTQDYTNGYFYKRVAQGTDPETYAWEAQPVQEEDKFRFTTMPTASNSNLGKIVEYIGETTSTYRKTEQYECMSDGTETKEYINNTSNFQKSGNTNCFTITSGNIRAYPSNPDESTAMVKLLATLSNSGTLKISRYSDSYGSLHDTHTCLGTTAGGRDLYVSPTWDDVGQSQTVVDTIDLSQYDASEIYLSFQMTVKNNDSYASYNIKSIKWESPKYKWENVGFSEDKFRYTSMPTASADNLGQVVQYIGETTSVEPIYTNGFFYKCVAQGTDPETYEWEQTNVQPTSEGDERIKPEITEIGVKFDDGLRPYIKVDISKIIPPFADATLSDIKDIVDAYYSGDISLADIQTVWKAGDTKTISVGAIESGGGSSNGYSAQDITMRIVDFDNYDLETTVGNKTKNLLTLVPTAYIANSENSGYSINGGESYQGWEGRPIRNWLNTSFMNALPNELQSIIKNIKRTVAGANSPNHQEDTLITDTIFVPRSIEMIGSSTAYTYFKTHNASMGADYWTCTPNYQGDGDRNIFVSSNGTSTGNIWASTKKKLVIAFCI